MRSVIVTIPAKSEHRAILEAAAPDMKFTYFGLKDPVPQELLAQAEVILGNVPPARLSEAKKLGFLQLYSAGSTDYAREGVLPEHVKLACATGAYGRSIAEYMVAVTFALMKKLPAYVHNMEDHAWKDEGHVETVFGSRTLVLGLGDIGGEYAKRMTVLGSHVTGIRRTEGEKPDFVEEVHLLSDLDELLPKADIVACALPGTDATDGLLTKERLLSMKKGSLLINVGRGSLIPEDGLIEGLSKGTPGAAAVDVTITEPLPADSPLWNVPNLLITPHVSGNYHTDDILNTVVDIAARNLKAYLTGAPLISEVDRATGYRRR